MTKREAIERDRRAALPDLPGYDWRPARREDVAAIHRLMLAVDEADSRTAAGVLEDKHRQFHDPWSDPTADSVLALDRGGQVAAVGRLFLNPEAKLECRVFFDLEIHPDHRWRGLEEAILAWGEARARQRVRTMPGHLPRVLQIACQDNLVDRIGFCERHGLKPVRHFYRMRRDLSQPIPDRSLPDGIELATYGAGHDRAAREAFNDSFQDHWGFEPITAGDWRMFLVGRSTFRPDLSHLALDGGQLVGLSLNFVSPEENEREGIQQGWVGELGVRRAWRRRGIATALLCHSMRAFKAEGLDYAALGVDTENPTGALGIYQRLGFAAVKRVIAFAKSLG